MLCEKISLNGKPLTWAPGERDEHIGRSRAETPVVWWQILNEFIKPFIEFHNLKISCLF